MALESVGEKVPLVTRPIGLPAADLRAGDPADLVLFHLDPDDARRPGSLRIERTIARGHVAF